MNRPPLIILALLACLAVVPVRAHDTGLSHSSRTLGITATERGYHLEYRVRVTPDVALLEMAAMDADRDGAISDGERDSWFTARGAALLAGLNLTWDSEETIPARLAGWSLGSALTQTYRFDVDCGPVALRVEDRNFQSQPGHMRIRKGPGIQVDAPEHDDLNHIDHIHLIITRLATPPPAE